MNVPLGLAPFDGQSRSEHALVLVGGALACLVGDAGAAAALFGVALCAGLLTAWASLLGEEAVAAWQREHLSEPFREAFVEE